MYVSSQESDSTHELVEKLEEFYRRYYADEIAALVESDSKERGALHIPLEDIRLFDPDVARDFVEQPEALMDYAEEALRLFPNDEMISYPSVTITNPNDKTDIDSIRSRHLEKLVTISGTVNRASEVRTGFLEVAFECQRCGTLTRVPTSPHKDTDDPHECAGCERRGSFEVNQKQCELVDVQTITIQQRHMGVGENADQASIAVELTGDLAGAVTPGETVTVTGILHLEDSSPRSNTTISDKYIDATGVTESSPYHYNITDDDKDEIVALAADDDIYEQMVGSLAPSVHGYNQAKLAVILQLFAGVPKSLPDETEIRGDIHIGLIGDPGTAKSKLLRQAAQLAPRAIHVSGNNTSAAGLTAATVRMKGGDSIWTFEVGALPMADRGVACIDDLTELRDEEQRALHGVLEKQVIDLSKASITTSIPARAGVLAAGNPKYGRFDPYEPIGEQLGLEPGVLSQFDLLPIISDEPDTDVDEELAKSVLEANLVGEIDANGEAVQPGIDETTVEEAADAVEPAIDIDLLRKYITFARENVFPVMTDDARETIRDFYVDVRANGVDDDAPVPVTARKLEGLVRLAEASARIRLSETVEEADAERAVELVRENLRDLGVDPEPEPVEMVETGTSATKRKRIKNVKSIISELEDKYADGASISMIIDRAEKQGMNRSKVEHEIEKLKDKGEVYEPKSDYLRAT